MQKYKFLIIYLKRTILSHNGYLSKRFTKTFFINGKSENSNFLLFKKNYLISMVIYF